MAQEQGKGLRLELTRVIKAGRAKVYEAWTNPEVMKTWMGPGGMVCPVANLDVRVGGQYEIRMEGTGGCDATNRREAVATGEYTKVVPNELLQFSWRASHNSDGPSLVTVKLRDVADGTEITLIHEQIASEGACGGYTKGWSGSLDKLEMALSN
jgi:uncharacterized protein YndB with AHSA1/START domain